MLRALVRLALASCVGFAVMLGAGAARTVAWSPPGDPLGPSPTPTIEPYAHPDFERRMRSLRPAILDAAARHNRPELSHMTDREFATVVALVLYSEHVGWLDAEVAAVRPISPLYQQAQIAASQWSGADLSIWPANVRPSVALEMLRGQVPVPKPTGVITVALSIDGSRVRPDAFEDERELFAALSREIADPRLAVEYLAANLERGLYRAQFERVGVTWQALAAWHNQGIVAPRDIRSNPTALGYIGRTAAYLPLARTLIEGPPDAAARLAPHTIN